MSLNQDITMDFDVLVPVISPVYSLVSTGVGVIRASSCAKPDPRITGIAVVFVVTKNTDSSPDALFELKPSKLQLC